MKATRIINDYVEYSWLEIDEKEREKKLEEAQQRGKFYNEWMDYRGSINWKEIPLTYKEYIEVKFSQIEHKELVATYMEDLTPRLDRRRSFREQLIEKNNDYKRRWE